MQIDYLRRVLADQSTLIAHMVEVVPSEEAHWKADRDSWSVVEIINHLVAEERGDFRVRLDLILHTPEQPWPKGTPGWFIEGVYNERDLRISLAEFLAERQSALAWMDTLGEPDWDAAVGTEWGPMRAGDVAASWVVHDLWHLQQIVQVRRGYAMFCLQPYDVTYAGTL